MSSFNTRLLHWRRATHVGVLLVDKGAEFHFGTFILHALYLQKRHISKVEPRGFEPLTSAVQMLAHHIADVRGRSNICLSKPLSGQASSPMFAVVLVGNCHVTVKSLMWNLSPDGKVVPTFADDLVAALAYERLLVPVLP